MSARVNVELRVPYDLAESRADVSSSEAQVATPKGSQVVACTWSSGESLKGANFKQ